MREISNLVSKLGGTEKLAKAAGVGGKTFAQQSAILVTAKTGIDAYQKYKNQIDFNYNPSKAEIEAASKIDFSN